MSTELCICENCGASYGKEESQCPYCGHLPENNVQKAYADKLNKVQQAAKELSDRVDKSYGAEMANQGKKIWKLVLCLGIIVVVFGGIFGACSLALDHYGPSDAEQVLWQRQYFPILDAYYEKEDFDAIEDLLREQYQYDIWQWKHADLYFFYANYKYICSCYEQFRENPEGISKKSKIYLFEDCINALYFQRENELTNQDLIYIHKWQEEIKEYFYSMFQISEEEILRNIPEFTTDYGSMDYEAVEKYGKKISFKNT
ncbi:MAG: hypothetical protein MJ134_05030 [Lachnospiraceae bacterium]|nr:hypothetical protein [Lachnospiraceae bacterium]